MENRGFRFLKRFRTTFQLGIDRLLSHPRHYVKHGNRIGLVAHAASMTGTLEHAAEAVAGHPDLSLVKLFSPEHGIYGVAQDMIAVDERTPLAGPRVGIPVKGLYGNTFESLWPTRDDFRDIDVLVIDLQDIGSRYYTYMYTMAFCMMRAKEAGVPVIVCDRPNPLGTGKVEGCPQERDYCSFVGWYPLPVRHGKTIGQLARHFNENEGIAADLTVIDVKGWNHSTLGMRPDQVWINPSPNMPSLQTALLYPGTCLIEGTNLSEGRGTTRPFEWIGAPFIESNSWIRVLEKLNLPGVLFFPWSFEPMFQKWKGETCHGVQVVVTDPDCFLPYRTGCALIATAYELYPKQFKWRTEPYEFVSDRLAIDLLTGSSYFRTQVEAGTPFETIMDTMG